MMTWLSGLGLLFVSTQALASAAPVARPKLREPLASAECALILLENLPSRRLVVNPITALEVDSILAVDDDAGAIRAFLGALFPGLNRAFAKPTRVQLAALWRRLPEFRPPALGPLDVDESIVVAWREFKAALLTLPVVSPDRRASAELTLEFNALAAARLAALAPAAIDEMLALPWEAKVIVNWLRARYPKYSVRQPGWGDRAFDLLWRETFGTTRPPSALGRYDADQVIFRKIMPVGPRDRVLGEWRIFVIQLNLHRK